MASVIFSIGFPLPTRAVEHNKVAFSYLSTTTATARKASAVSDNATIKPSFEVQWHVINITECVLYSSGFVGTRKPVHLMEYQ